MTDSWLRQILTSMSRHIQMRKSLALRSRSRCIATVNLKLLVAGHCLLIRPIAVPTPVSHTLYRMVMSMSTTMPRRWFVLHSARRCTVSVDVRSSREWFPSSPQLQYNCYGKGARGFPTHARHINVARRTIQHIAPLAAAMTTGGKPVVPSRVTIVDSRYGSPIMDGAEVKL